MLPDAFENDPDRLARFTREAQVLAALNHPNIAAIYGVEDRALVMDAVVAGTFGFLYWRAPRPVLHPLQRFDIPFTPPERLHSFLPLSSDGKRLAYVQRNNEGVQRLYTRLLDQPEGRSPPFRVSSAGGTPEQIMTMLGAVVAIFVWFLWESGLARRRIAGRLFPWSIPGRSACGFAARARNRHGRRKRCAGRERSVSNGEKREACRLIALVVVGGIAADRKSPPWEKDRLREGHALYRENCVVCHDIDKAQSKKLGPSFYQLFRREKMPIAKMKPNRDHIKVRVQFGGAVMPAFRERLKAGQIETLIDYIASR